MDEKELFVDLNGEMFAWDQAKVSVWDRGFLFGDAIFESVRLHKGRPVLWEEHMERLRESAAGVRFERLPGSRELLSRVERLVERNNLQEATIYIQVTRGSVGKRTDSEMPNEPTVLVALDPHACLPEETYRRGVSAITVEDIRWRYSHLKTTNLLPRTLARIEAAEKGAHEAIFRGEDGQIYEGTSTNVFVLKSGILKTPPLSQRLLRGATRGVVLELARELVREVREEPVHVGELYSADEVFLSGTTTEVLGVVRLDGRTIGDGRVGEVALSLRALYRKEVLGD